MYNIPVHTSGTIPIRHKRQIFVAAAAAGAILGTFLGLFNSKEISDKKHNLLKLSDQHNILTSIVNKHEHELATLHSELKSLTNSVELLIMYNPALIYAILRKTVTAMNNRISVLFDTLQQLQHQRLAVSLLSESQLQVVFDAARNSAHHHNVDLIPGDPQDLFQGDASYIHQGDEILILLHIPTAASDKMLSLYEYVPFPFPLRKNANSPLADFDSILSLQDLANTEHFPATSAIHFKSDYPMIAVGRNKNLNTASYRLISQADLTACIQKRYLYLCETQQT
jgi:hypothetical protein